MKFWYALLYALSIVLINPWGHSRTAIWTYPKIAVLSAIFLTNSIVLAWQWAEHDRLIANAGGDTFFSGAPIWALVCSPSSTAPFPSARFSDKKKWAMVFPTGCSLRVLPYPGLFMTIYKDTRKVCPAINLAIYLKNSVFFETYSTSGFRGLVHNPGYAHVRFPDRSIVALDSFSFATLEKNGSRRDRSLPTNKAHNLLLDVALSSGLLGLVAYGGLAIARFRLAARWQSVPEGKSPERLFAAIAIVYFTFALTWFACAQYGHLLWWALSAAGRSHREQE